MISEKTGTVTHDSDVLCALKRQFLASHLLSSVISLVSQFLKKNALPRLQRDFGASASFLPIVAEFEMRGLVFDRLTHLSTLTGSRNTGGSLWTNTLRHARSCSLSANDARGKDEMAPSSPHRLLFIQLSRKQASIRQTTSAVVRHCPLEEVNGELQRLHLFFRPPAWSFSFLGRSSSF
ncbi:hypothetical protein BLNAU_1230 [Blattamonas nauphoetae]|uniref:Uncharacterized protein n=1 Tax=Blattamonas nauphoetae TaxID=2049346 RepID=A0ABQ9YJ41_9EUKA|nr:hypothetical protein BLNAU_1230 [Blattamonas nauphoetae]